MFNTIEEAIADLKLGKPIIVVDDENRENEGDFVALSSTITPEIINQMITEGRGLVCVSITEKIGRKLKLDKMVSTNTDPFGTAFTESIDFETTTTGISAYERADTIKAMIDEDVKPEQFKRPGHIFPLIAKNRGVLERQGHTEAAVDLAKLSGYSPSAVICEIIKEDGHMARLPDLIALAKRLDLKLITIEELIQYRKENEIQIKREVVTDLPTEFGEFKVYGYSNTLDDKEHLAIVKGDLTNESLPVVRIHSECLTGDVFQSNRCDCGPQLEAALRIINKTGHGVLIYMRQEGRGIGLINKLKAYKLQDTGLDTVEANEALGFAADLREYELASQILKDLNVNDIELLTNNPLKVTALEKNNINIKKRSDLQVGKKLENTKYLQTKKVKLGHLFI
ncbi:MAG TPA: bifunctional 3,4-dihydroxy-2-butanone-4-phosphate synthase/GTP cyclohydrolase II [Pseudogracilibacillus sp.]|nr:bifunctional 3,4-dihydroxy-2-butanone-4-phosphate synthase/GTP cyclohydrolase II [Pseudogracilibacillus sp.]